MGVSVQQQENSNSTLVATATNVLRVIDILCELLLSSSFSSKVEMAFYFTLQQDLFISFPFFLVSSIFGQRQTIYLPQIKRQILEEIEVKAVIDIFWCHWVLYVLVCFGFLLLRKYLKKLFRKSTFGTRALKFCHFNVSLTV